MPPRYVFWTILIDGKATAFRAREKEELLPTFNQLRRTNKDVVMKWFARGRLWETPDEASAALRTRVVPERRGPEWRPGGAHKDPRDRFKKGATRHDERPAFTPSGKPGGVAQTFRPAHRKPPYKPSGKPAGTAQAFRPAHARPPYKPAGGAQPFRPAHKPHERRPWTNKAGSGTGGSRPRRDSTHPRTFKPDRRESEAPPRPGGDPRPGPPPRPEKPWKKPEPPERG